MVEVGFACEYCGEVLATEADEKGIVSSDEFHGCFGERPGYLGSVETDRVLTRDAIELVVDP